LLLLWVGPRGEGERALAGRGVCAAHGVADDGSQMREDEWMRAYNEERPHQGRWCFGKTPAQTFLDAKPLAKEKLIQAA